jgi:hypothetical protein
MGHYVYPHGFSCGSAWVHVRIRRGHVRIRTVYYADLHVSLDLDAGQQKSPTGSKRFKQGKNVKRDIVT